MATANVHQRQRKEQSDIVMKPQSAQRDEIEITRVFGKYES